MLGVFSLENFEIVLFIKAITSLLFITLFKLKINLNFILNVKINDLSTTNCLIISNPEENSISDLQNSNPRIDFNINSSGMEFEPNEPNEPNETSENTINNNNHIRNKNKNIQNMNNYHINKKNENEKQDISNNTGKSSKNRQFSEIDQGTIPEENDEKSNKLKNDKSINRNIFINNNINKNINKDIKKNINHKGKKISFLFQSNIRPIEKPEHNESNEQKLEILDDNDENVVLN